MADLTLRWVSRYLRRAILEIWCQEDIPPPLDNGDGLTWQQTYDQVGWRMKVEHKSVTAAEYRFQEQGPGWTEGQLHDFMGDRRREAEVPRGEKRLPLLDENWRYVLLCVSKIRRNVGYDEEDMPIYEYLFGVMYDDGSVDSPRVPREGAAIAAKAEFPCLEIYDKLKHTALADNAKAYFRTAVHEIAHAQNLDHNPFRPGFMQETHQIATAEGGKFPDNIPWYFAPDDAHRLRHMPDPWVRSGGMPFLHRYLRWAAPTEDLIEDLEGLELDVIPLASFLPLGAPLRLGLEMRAVEAKKRFDVPGKLSLKGPVSGRVIDSSGNVRTFSPMVNLVPGEPVLRALSKGETVRGDMTLLRGKEGALLPSPGSYRIEVDVTWDTPASGFRMMRVRGQASVLVDAPKDPAGAQTALEILAAREFMGTVVLGERSPNEDGAEQAATEKAFQGALGSDVLGPHYEIFKIKRAVRDRSTKRPKELTDWIRRHVGTDAENPVILTESENQKLRNLVMDYITEASDRKALSKILDVHGGMSQRQDPSRA